MNPIESSTSVTSTTTTIAAISVSGSAKRREPSVAVENDKNQSEPVCLPVIHGDVHGDGDIKVGATKRRCQRLRSITPTNVLEQEELGWHSIPDDVMTQIMLAATTDPKELFGFETSCKLLLDTVDRCWSILARDMYPQVRLAQESDSPTGSTGNTDSSNDNSDSVEGVTATVTGKEMWIEGRALESLSTSRCKYTYFRNADPDVFRQGVFFGSNTSILVMSSSDHHIPTLPRHQQLFEHFLLPQLPPLPLPMPMPNANARQNDVVMRRVAQELVLRYQGPEQPEQEAQADLQLLEDIMRELNEDDGLRPFLLLDPPWLDDLNRRRPRRRHRHQRHHQWGRGGFLPPNPIRIRDASTLQILANMEGSPRHKAVDVFGPAGNEVIVEYLDDCLKAYRNCKLVWEHHWHSSSSFTVGNETRRRPPRLWANPTDHWCLLPSERALLVVRDERLHMFLIDDTSNRLPYLATTAALGQVEAPTMNWVKEGFSFVLHVRPGEVTFWNIHHDTGRTTNVRTMRLAVAKSFSFVYTGTKHLVAAGAHEDDAMYVFDRNGNLLHRLLEDIPKPLEDYRWSPMNACLVQGCLLVSNSLMGAALCVWNLRTGLLVHRFEQSMDQGHCCRPGEDFTDGTWVHCMDQLPSFDFPFFLLADNDGSLFSWGFPECYSQKRRIRDLATLAADENR